MVLSQTNTTCIALLRKHMMEQRPHHVTSLSTILHASSNAKDVMMIVMMMMMVGGCCGGGGDDDDGCVRIL